MVRFIMTLIHTADTMPVLFTFQYGQIYYDKIFDIETNARLIYIPIWLDLLCECDKDYLQKYFYLHSNMVRFIIYDEMREKQSYISFTFQYGQIYY